MHLFTLGHSTEGEKRACSIEPCLKNRGVYSSSGPNIDPLFIQFLALKVGVAIVLFLFLAAKQAYHPKI